MEWSNLSSREQKLILIGLIVILSVGYYYYIYQPQVKRLAEVKQQVEQKLNELRVESKVLEKKKELKQKYELLQQQLQEKEGNFLEIGDDSRLIVDLGNLADQTGVELLSTGPAESIKDDIYIQYPVKVNLEGTYNNIIDFVNKIVELDYLIRIQNLNISSKLAPTDRIQVEMRIIGYALEQKSGDR
ncbi:type 4a pilus biogenesis protein PilO [Acetohalobium arabaticum]|nr:type 4a pilus biogenesis protein PilO [Acetohalobium arabaticum]